MIWYQEDITCLDQPDDFKLTLSGIYNQPGTSQPTIIIRLTVTGPGPTLIVKSLFEKTPSTLCYEEPSGDQVLAKYNAKLQKLKSKIENATFAAFANWPLSPP